MLTNARRVMVAVRDDEARVALVEDLKADGYEPLAATTLGHARSRLSAQVDALLLDLGSESIEVIDLVRSGACPGADLWLSTIAGTTNKDLCLSVRLL